MYVCIYVYTDAYGVYPRKELCVHMYTHSVCIHIYMYVIYLCMYAIYVYMYIHMNMAYIQEKNSVFTADPNMMFFCISICIYIYVCIYTNAYGVHPRILCIACSVYCIMYILHDVYVACCIYCTVYTLRCVLSVVYIASCMSSVFTCTHTLYVYTYICM